ncbi:bifunctional adenosylcobinamide kinase/adenosylcobinamide-phosphate guanylyltransferase [Sulfurivermis fontis]|uniref:bifunctional adenosylcobinamide kinase/adenosylcobinamide-phosphate guanylyltransferase n=1 Tax=Sulfurivermis fontis TaxID=1972068 RepID=UPI000FDC91BA|nr:bifunctional adenosylcobinamide kinase/adenosylcobinamide-phosphate guanylyltransferase [Sulfurivermis fontis]
MKHLILGGARSGKSRHAEQLAAQAGRSVVYIATAEALDEEMAMRITHHRARRPADWALVEEPLALAQVLRREAAAHRCLLVDCLTLWLGNLLALDDARMQQETHALYAALPELSGDILLVSNEVGWGIVPDNPLARRFRDEAGRLHQRLAELCDHVSLVAAGLPLRLK